jgi:predicted nucleic acid-binding protein
MAMAVSDASPLICLAAIRHFNLLRFLYGEVLVPRRQGGNHSHSCLLRQPHRLKWLPLLHIVRRFTGRRVSDADDRRIRWAPVQATTKLD